MYELEGIWTPNQELNSLISKRGGFVNCHAHLDRARTLSLDVYEQTGDASLSEKWELNEELKISSWYRESMGLRMDMEIATMREQGCFACRTYIDADTTIGLFAIERGLEAKEYWAKKGFTLQIVASPVKGIEDAEGIAIFREAAALADVVGGLPSRGRSDVFDQRTSVAGMRDLFEIAANLDKPIDMQIDQVNHPDELELWLFVEVAQQFRREGYKQSITAVHAISPSAWYSDVRREQCFELLRPDYLDINVVVCPGAALSMQQLMDVRAPTHNSIAPVAQLLGVGVNVAFGVDNVEDMYMPFTTGDIAEEMREMLRAIRWQGPLEPIADIMSTNGKKVLGL